MCLKVITTNKPLHFYANVISQKYNFFSQQKYFSDSREDQGQDAALAQLIADSTEKRFKINNIFKVKWKKKNYSFDLS